MTFSHRITPCLWFDDQAEEAATLYTSIFPNSKITAASRYGEAGKEIHGKKPGTAMTLSFELAGQAFTALNGGPQFTFNEAISLQIGCATQQEVDHYWDKLTAGGDARAQQCGWLEDKFGVSWQVIPSVLIEIMTDPNRAQRAMPTMMSMKKFDIAALVRASEG